jgi:hypothetical protein
MRFIRFVLLSLVFLMFFVGIIVAILLLSAGLLAIPVSLAVMSGLFTRIITIASDLSPLAMFLTGVSCISAGLALSLLIVYLFPKQQDWFKRLC